jgi:hypothetical protein
MLTLALEAGILCVPNRQVSTSGDTANGELDLAVDSMGLT